MICWWFYAPARKNVIDFVTIASTGNATDFGDLTTSKISLKVLGDVHGGLINTIMSQFKINSITDRSGYCGYL